MIKDLRDGVDGTGSLAPRPYFVWRLSFPIQKRSNMLHYILKKFVHVKIMMRLLLLPDPVLMYHYVCCRCCQHSLHSWAAYGAPSPQKIGG